MKLLFQRQSLIYILIVNDRFYSFQINTISSNLFLSILNSTEINNYRKLQIKITNSTYFFKNIQIYIQSNIFHYDYNYNDFQFKDIQEIRAKYGWKPKNPPQAPPAQRVQKPATSATKSTSSRSREEPVKKGKDNIVYEVLKRWWYALPDWPPANYDYSSALEQNKLRVVNKQKFRIAPDVDDKGFSKCYEILGYQGLFKDVNNKLFDLRPDEGKPSYTSLSRKSEIELIGLLKIALQKQIEELEKSKVIDEDLLIMLKRQYEKVKLRVKD